MELKKAVHCEKPYKITAQKVINGDLRDFPLCGFTRDGKPAVLVNEASNSSKDVASYRRVFIKKDPNNEKQLISANGEMIEFESLPKSEFKLVIKELSGVDKQTKPSTPSASTVKETIPNRCVDKPIVPPPTLNGSKVTVSVPTQAANNQEKPIVVPATKISVIPQNSATAKVDVLSVTPKKDIPTAKLIGVLKSTSVIPQKMPALVYTTAKKPKAIIISSSSSPLPTKQSVTTVNAQNAPTAKVVNFQVSQKLRSINSSPKVTAKTNTTAKAANSSMTSNTPIKAVEKTPNATLVSVLKTTTTMAPSTTTPNTPLGAAMSTKAPNISLVTATSASPQTYAMVSPLPLMLSNGQQLILAEDNFQLNNSELKTIVTCNTKKLQDQAVNTTNESFEQSTSTQDLIVNRNTCSQTPIRTTQTKESQTDFEIVNRSATNSPCPSIDDLLRYVLSNNETEPGETYSGNQTANQTTLHGSYTQHSNAKLQFFNDLRQSVKYDMSGNLPIHVAVMKNDLKEVKKQCFLLRTVQKGVNVMNSNNLTPIQLAVLYDVDPQIVYILVDSGADVSVIDAEGNTLIHLAVLNSQDVVLTYLVKVALVKGINIDLYNYEGCTPLIMCASTEKHEIARILLESNADPNVRDQKSGRTALFHAIENNDEKMVFLLLQYRADTRVRNYFGTSPHDAMYELDSIKNSIRLRILGKDAAMNRIRQGEQRKRRMQGETEDEDSNHSPPKKNAIANLNSIMNLYPECTYEIIQ